MKRFTALFLVVILVLGMSNTVYAEEVGESTPTPSEAFVGNLPTPSNSPSQTPIPVEAGGDNIGTPTPHETLQPTAEPSEKPLPSEILNGDLKQLLLISDALSLLLSKDVVLESQNDLDNILSVYSLIPSEIRTEQIASLLDNDLISPIIVEVRNNNYGLLIDYFVDEQNAIISLTVIDVEEQEIIIGIGDIVRMWAYIVEENDEQSECSPIPSATATPCVSPSVLPSLASVTPSLSTEPIDEPLAGDIESKAIGSVSLDSVETLENSGEIAIAKGETITLSASAVTNTSEALQYKFYYQKQGADTWTAVHSGYIAGTPELGQVEFKPAAEATYNFKVQVRTSGTTIIEAEDVFGGDVTVYFGDYPTQSVIISSLEKTQYENSETIPLAVTIEQNTNCSPVEYRVRYSTNGSKWAVLASTKYWPDLDLDESGNGVIPVQLPTAGDRHYFIKVEIRSQFRTTVDASDICEVDMYKYMPLESVNFESAAGCFDTEEMVLSKGDTITLEASATPQTGYHPNEVQYRFWYQKPGSTRWFPVTSAYTLGTMANVSQQFKPTVEGIYRFKVLARVKGRSTIDAEDEFDGDIGLYFVNLPTKSVTIATLTKTQYEYAESISLDLSVERSNSGADVEYQIMYSVNNRSWRVLPEYKYWQALSLNDENKATVQFTLSSSSDKHVYIKVNVRSKGRASADVADVCEVDMYQYMPLKSVRINSVAGFTSEDEMALQKGKAIEIMASAIAQDGYDPEIVEYRVQYQRSGTTKWYYVSSKYTVGTLEEGLIIFIPKYEGVYHFKVEARIKGRKTPEVSANFEAPIGIYFGELPTNEVSIAEITKTNYEYSEILQLDLTVDKSNNEAPVECQVMISTNNRKWRVLKGDVAVDYRIWQDLDLDGAGTATIDVQLPSSKDMHYYIKVCVRSEGRQSGDVSDVVEVDMYKVMPLGSAMLNSVNGEETASAIAMNKGDQITLTASALAQEGYNPSLVDYRFLYHRASTGKWYYVSKKYTVGTLAQVEKTFTPRYEDVYTFKVQARAKGRGTVDAEDVFDEPTSIVFDVPELEPVQEVVFENEMPAPIIERTVGNTITLAGGVRNTDYPELVEYRFCTRENNDRAWVSCVQDWSYDNTVEFTYEDDITYSFVVQARRPGIGVGTNVYSEWFAVYEQMPEITAVTFENEWPADNTAFVGDVITLIGGVIDTIEPKDVEYRFCYKKNGEQMWHDLQNWSMDTTVDFTFGDEGPYSFVVQARRPGDDCDDLYMYSEWCDSVRPIVDNDLSLKIFDSNDVEITNNADVISLGDTITIVPQLSNNDGSSEVTYRYNYRYTSLEGDSKGYNIVQTQDNSLEFDGFTKRGMYEFVIYAKQSDQAEFARYELGTDFAIDELPPIEDGDLSLKIAIGTTEITNNADAIEVGDTITITPILTNIFEPEEILYRYNYRYTLDSVSNGYNITQTQNASIEFDEFTKEGMYEFVIYAKRPDQDEFARYELETDFIVENSKVYLYSKDTDAGGLKIRSSPGSSTVKANIPWGKKFEYHQGTDTDIDGKTWIKVTYNGTTGWLDKAYTWDKRPYSRGHVIPTTGTLKRFDSSDPDSSHYEYGALDIFNSWETAIKASKAGWVRYSGKECYYNKNTFGYVDINGNSISGKAQGLCIIIDHGDGSYSYYEHLSSRIANEGDYVTQGEIIGRMGNTGRCISTYTDICTPDNKYAVHLHFSINSSGSFGGNKDLRKFFNVREGMALHYGDKWD